MLIRLQLPFEIFCVISILSSPVRQAYRVIPSIYNFYYYEFQYTDLFDNSVLEILQRYQNKMLLYQGENTRESHSSISRFSVIVVGITLRRTVGKTSDFFFPNHHFEYLLTGAIKSQQRWRILQKICLLEHAIWMELIVFEILRSFLILSIELDT